MIPLMTYPIYIGGSFGFPFRKRMLKPKFVHEKPQIRNNHYYSHRATGIEWLGVRLVLVWKNPPNDCGCPGCRIDP